MKSKREIPPYKYALAMAVTGLISASILLPLHDRFWYPPDDGAYAHVARRLNAGEVLHRDVQDVHLGTINFVNALALRAFGDRLVSLRYPLVVLGCISALLASCLFLQSGSPFSTVVAIGFCVSALSIVQFLNPTANWYCYCLFWTIVWILSSVPIHVTWRTPLVGILLGVMFQFRQLSGLLMAMGVVSLLLWERRDMGRESRQILAKLISSVMALGLLAYLTTKTETLTLILYGGGPLVSLLAIGFRCQADNWYVIRVLGQLAGGAALSLLPLVSYHIYHHSVWHWLHDTLLVAESLTRLDFFRDISFPLISRFAVQRMLTPNSVGTVTNGLFWCLALAAGPLLGLLVARQLIARERQGLHLPTLTIPATLFSVVSLHFQIPIYLFYTLSITLSAIIATLHSAPGWRRFTTVATVWLAAIGLIGQAAQPTCRGLAGILSGQRVAQHATLANPYHGLEITAADARLYTRLMSVIDQHVSLEDEILAIPVNPELYFLSGRRNPVRFFNSALGIKTSEDLSRTLASIDDTRPRLVFYQSGDKYNTAGSRAIVAHIRSSYDRLPDVGEFEIYRSPAPGRAQLAGSSQSP